MYSDPNRPFDADPVVLIDVSAIVNECPTYFPEKVVRNFEEVLPVGDASCFLHMFGEWERQNAILRLKDKNEFLGKLKELVRDVTNKPMTIIIAIPDSVQFADLFKRLAIDQTSTLIAQAFSIVLSSVCRLKPEDAAAKALDQVFDMWEWESRELTPEILLPILLFVWVEAAKIGRSFIFCPDLKEVAPGFNSADFNSLSYLQVRAGGDGRTQVPPGESSEPVIPRYQEDSLFIESAPLKIEEAQQFVATVIGRQTMNIGPTVGDKPKSRFLVAKPFSKEWEAFSINAKNIEYDLWFTKEFGSRRIGRRFLDISTIAFRNTSKLVQEMRKKKTGLLPIEIVNSLAAARLARRMSTWNLEGTPFRCNLVLLDETKLKNLGSGTPRFHPLINLSPPVPLNFLHEEKLRDHSELAQGDGLFLIASANDGKVHFICSEADIVSHSRYRRVTVFSSLVSKSGLLFHIHGPSKIELYSPPGLSLWWDGFEWRDRPIADLELALQYHFEKQSDVDNKLDLDSSLDKDERDKDRRSSLGNSSELVITMVDVIGRLIDRCESSIIIFIDPKDSEKLFQLAGEQLREGWHWSTASVEIQLLSPDALTGLMHVDGAQVIDIQGNIVAVARRIDERVPRYNLNITREDRESMESYLRERQQFDSFSFAELRNETDSDEVQLLINRFSHIAQIRSRGLPEAIAMNWINEVVKETYPYLASVSPLNIEQQDTIEEIENLVPNLVFFDFVDYNGEERKGVLDRSLDNNQRATASTLREILPSLNFDNPVLAELGPIFPYVAIPEINLQELPDVDLEAEGWQDTEFEPSNIRRCYRIRVKAEQVALHEQHLLDQISLSPGVGFDNANNWVILEGKLNEIVYGDQSTNPIPTFVRERSRMVIERPPNNQVRSSGTGTRVAERLADNLPNSLVVKVSASGKLYILGGKRFMPKGDY